MREAVTVATTEGGPDLLRSVSQEPFMGPGIRGFGAGAARVGCAGGGSGVRWSWPLYGSGLGIYYSTPRPIAGL
jgi:hypothetical protein